MDRKFGVNGEQLVASEYSAVKTSGEPWVPLVDVFSATEIVHVSLALQSFNLANAVAFHAPVLVRPSRAVLSEVNASWS